MRSFPIVDSIVEPLGPPQREGIVKLEDVNTTTGILVAATVHLQVTISTVDGDQFIGRRPAEVPASTLYVTIDGTIVSYNTNRREPVYQEDTMNELRRRMEEMLVPKNPIE
uniref:Golgi resident protein GCP60 n=1 Tax=Schistocephalus solidus TaxID=70667 RepID=A0A0X3PB92_SCHSO